MSEDIRKIVQVKTVDSVSAIVDADRIEKVMVGGWAVVVGKGEFQAGEQVLYFEVDAALPLDDERFEFLRPRSCRQYEGREVHVLKTVRLRGVYSQGLLMPLSAFTEQELEGDIAANLNVVKYDPPLPATIGGSQIGNFPTQFASKTDAERVQNLTEIYGVLFENGPWQATEKIDGTSMTVIRDGDKMRVASRNYEMADDGKNSLWGYANEHDAFNGIPEGFTVQGELAGPGIQGNKLKLNRVQMFVFNVVRNRQPVPRNQWPEWCAERAVPLLETLELPDTVEQAVEQADGMKSVVNPQVLAEGIVWHHKEGREFPELEGRANFKVISNKWLLKNQ